MVEGKNLTTPRYEEEMSREKASLVARKPPKDDMYEHKNETFLLGSCV